MSDMGGRRAVGHVVDCGFIITWRAWLLATGQVQKLNHRMKLKTEAKLIFEGGRFAETATRD